MQGTIKSVNDGIVNVLVRRNSRTEQLQGRHYDLRVGTKVQCHRQVNNPYLQRTANSAGYFLPVS